MKHTEQFEKLSEELNLPENHLKYLLEDTSRLNHMILKKAGVLFDYTRQRVNREVMNELVNFSVKSGAKKTFSDMVSGKQVNMTEKRSALHTATRDLSSKPVYVEGVNIKPDLLEVNCEIKSFSEEIRSGSLKGSTGKKFQNVVVVGIGGSYLGTEFVYEALKELPENRLNLMFLSNVDIDNFGEIACRVDAEETLWVIISKSYTTSETLLNRDTVYRHLESSGLDPKHHVVTVTAKGSPGDTGDNPVLKSFYMFNFIGGRYSVSSAVGGVPLSIALGFNVFERFLKGAHELDVHAETAPESENIPLISALLGIWNNLFLRYSALGIIPYSSPLSKLPAHIQQLYMESAGKSATVDNNRVEYDTGVFIFGEPGTNAQHSFFQLAHQGRAFPMEFIGVVNPVYEKLDTNDVSVSNHQELWANMISQANSLAVGKENSDTSRNFPGNRPSSTLLIDSVTPENIGKILAYYEAKTVYESFLLNINPFDQFGVELGKINAKSLKKEMTEKNKNSDYQMKSDPISKFYMDILFDGKI